MLRLLALLSLIGLAQAQTQQVTIPAQTVPVVVPSSTVSVTVPAQTLKILIPAQIVTIPSSSPTPPPPAPPSGIIWMYLNGVKTLAGDFTQGSTSVNYQNATASGYNGGTKDILFTATAPWGLFLPYWAANYALPNPGYTYFLIALKPTITGDTFGIHAEKPGDVDPGCHIELVTAAGNSYGPAAVKGIWGVYKVPLTDLCIAGDSTLYKVAIATHTGTADSWEMDAIGFE